MGFNLILPDGHSCNYSSPRFSRLQNPIRVEENICNAQGLGGLSVAERDICHFLSYPGTHFEILINYAIIAKSALSLAPISPYLCEPILIIRLCAGVKSAFSKKILCARLHLYLSKLLPWGRHQEEWRSRSEAIYGSFLEIFYQRKSLQFEPECNRAGPWAREVPPYKADTDING